MVLSMDALDMALLRKEGEPGVTSEDETGEVLKVTGAEVNQATKRVPIYEVRTGEPRTIPQAMLRATLRKTHKLPLEPDWNGRRIFSIQPTVPYVQRAGVCFLHPSMPERPLYDSWGLATCLSAHLADPVSHAHNKHPKEWLRKEDAERRTREEEDRRLQKEQLSAQAAILTAMAGRQQPVDDLPLYVSDKPPKRRKPRG